MIIGIDASRANRKHKSGTEWYSYYLIRELAKLDSENQYILYSDEPLCGDLADLSSDELVPNEPHYDAQGFQIIQSPHGNFKAKILGWPFKFLWTQGRLSLEMIVKSPDVLFIPSHTLPFFHPKKSIITIHDVGFEKNRQLYQKAEMGPQGRRKRRLINFLVRLFTGGRFGANSMDYYAWSTIFGLRHAKKIITVSNFSKKEILGYFGKERGFEKVSEKIVVIHNGYNRDRFRLITDPIGRQAVLNKFGIETPYLFYVGRLERKKNICNLVEGYALLLERRKDIRHQLVLAGDASFGYDEVKYMISHYNLEDRIIKTGWVAECDMPYLYSAALAFVFPSFYEGFGIPLLQAMACGTPIVASNAASIPEVVGDAGLSFDPESPMEISETLEKIIDQKDLRDRLIGRGLVRVKQFGWDKTAGEVLTEIEKLK